MLIAIIKSPVNTWDWTHTNWEIYPTQYIISKQRISITLDYTRHFLLMRTCENKSNKWFWEKNVHKCPQKHSDTLNNAVALDCLKRYLLFTWEDFSGTRGIHGDFVTLSPFVFRGVSNVSVNKHLPPCSMKVNRV